MFSLIKKMDGNIKEVLNGAFIALLVKVIAVMISFFLNIVLGRMLDPKGTGIYFLLLTVVTIASTFGRAGLDNTIVRLVSAEYSNNNWSHINEIYKKSNIIVVAYSLVITIIIVLSVPMWDPNSIKSVSSIKGTMVKRRISFISICCFSMY